MYPIREQQWEVRLLILDGRNRAAACERAGIEPETVVYEGDDLAEYVIDANITRRNMSTGARAMATALILQAAGHRENGRVDYGALKEKLSGSGQSLNRQRMAEAWCILDYKPDLADAVVAGDLALDAAYQQAEAIRTSAEWDKIMEKEREKREKTEAAAVAEKNAGIIAPIIGVGHKTVARDLAGVSNDTPGLELPPVRTGLDGKTYQPRPLPDEAALRERREREARAASGRPTRRRRRWPPRSGR